MRTEVSQEPKKPKKKGEKDKKVVSLKVIKNNLIKKAEAADRKFYKDCVHAAMSERPLPNGWAFVSWGEDGYTITYLVEDEKQLYWMPEMVKTILMKDIQENFFKE